MKSIFTLLVLATVVLLSSCGSADILVLKRRYNTGYYVDVNTKKAEKTTTHKSTLAKAENADAVTADFNTEKEPETEAVVKEEELPLTAGADNHIYSAPPINKNIFSKTTAQKSVDQSVLSSTEGNTKAPKIGVINRVKHKIAKTLSDEDTNKTILLVILSLFPILALIAVYLKDGKKITTNFWIDLLLHLPVLAIATSWGRFVVALYAIFAILVVLDIINLA